MIPISGALSVIIDRVLRSRSSQALDDAKAESLNVQTTGELTEVIHRELNYFTDQLTAARSEIHALTDKVNKLTAMVIELGGDPNAV